MKKDLWQRAEELFHNVLELSPAARRAFLDRACGEDAELRNQVETLLSQDEQAGSFLEKPALADAAITPIARDSLVGRQFGQYRILSSLGAGGMGEVYRAHDGKLGRDVAIKTLPPEFARDPDRVARFNREAKLLASLNHPNIAAIYGLEESGGTNFLVLELAEGQTLADHIKSGPIPIEESLKLALQIAEALEAAHEKGVIHRDLKPANIKVTPDGKVKVLDFGLAKAFAGEQAEVNLSNSPTLSNAATQQGVILGTAAYMSPEQARGKPVDKRGDIWAFGCVLFEMLTRRPAFPGDDLSDILSAVIRSEPDWSWLPANLHWRIKELLGRCLEKEARNRYGGISDARVEIQKTLANPSGVLTQPAITTPPKRRPLLKALWVAAVVLTAIIAGTVLWEFKPSEPRQVMRFDYSLPDGQQFSNPIAFALSISPDGKQFVYATPKGLFLRSADELTAKRIAGTEGSTLGPFFSPDGKWIGYFSLAEHKLKKVPVGGGTPAVLCDVTGWLGACWNDDGTIIYGQSDSIMRISANGGTPESIVTRKSKGLADPQILPNGKSVLYTAYPFPVVRIMVQSLKSGEPKELFPGIGARYIPTGHILYLSPDSSKFFAVPFDPDKLEVNGNPIPLLERVGTFAVSKSGTLAYITGGSWSGVTAQENLVWVNREGKEEPISAVPPNIYSLFRISPDGMRVALTIGVSPKEQIWILDVARESMTPLILDEGTGNSWPIWAPDGKRIAFASRPENTVSGDIFWRAADGTGGIEKLASSPDRQLFPDCWSNDGKTLVVSEMTPKGKWDIGLLSIEGNHAIKPLLQEAHSERHARISHDGKWMAYVSDESSKSEVYVRPFPDVNTGKWQVSTGGGSGPLWSPDDRELYYFADGAAMAVPVETEPAFKLGKPTVLFRGTYPVAPWAGTTFWDISPDGKRFLMMKEETPQKINIVVNWFEELKQRIPAK